MPLRHVLPRQKMSTASFSQAKDATASFSWAKDANGNLQPTINCVLHKLIVLFTQFRYQLVLSVHTYGYIYGWLKVAFGIFCRPACLSFYNVQLMFKITSHVLKINILFVSMVALHCFPPLSITSFMAGTNCLTSSNPFC